MHNQLHFTLADCQSPERLERLLRQLNLVLATVPTSEPKLPSTAALAEELAPLIRSELEAPGIAPLNLQSLLPQSGLGIVTEDTHANRLALYPASSSSKGALFWETDRTVLYIVEENAGVLSWQYAGGMMTSSTLAGRPTDLGTTDDGFQLWLSSQNHKFRWSGTGWAFMDTEGGYIQDRVAAPTSSGWQLCDGTATDYLQISAGDIVETAFTTPDENTAPAGVYHESIAAYTGVINAAAAPGISGSVANTTATNQATTATNQNTVVTAHTVKEIDTVAAGTGDFLFEASADAAHATHGHTQDSHNHTQDAHLHAVGTLVVDATGEPRRMGVLRYFRR